MESDHCGKFKMVVELCKASGVNFSVMCSANVDMAIKTFHASGEISKEGTYIDETYFVLDPDERKLVDNHSKEICLATHFLFLSSDRLQS